METEPTIQLDRNPVGNLVLHTGGQSIPVRLVRCFPWAQPDRWLSLRDDDGNEHVLIEDPAQLPERSREVLLAELQLTRMTFEVTRILSVVKDIELRCWEVETAQGPRRFQTELDEWPSDLPDGGYLLRDVCGDLYTVGTLESLDPKSRALLWALVG